MTRHSGLWGVQHLNRKRESRMTTASIMNPDLAAAVVEAGTLMRTGRNSMSGHRNANSSSGFAAVET